MALARGFKAEAERIVDEFRQELKASAHRPLDPFRLAEHLGIEAVPADQLVRRKSLRELEALQAGSFSACTFRPSAGRTVIVYNPLHSVARRRSDIAHELAHIILDHNLTRLERVGGVSFFVCDASQEEEAAWLSGCLLLPRNMLLSSLRRGLSPEEIATRYGISERMVLFRIYVTGVRRQVQAGMSRGAVAAGRG